MRLMTLVVIVLAGGVSIGLLFSSPAQSRADAALEARSDQQVDLPEGTYTVYNVIEDGRGTKYVFWTTRSKTIRRGGELRVVQERVKDFAYVPYRLKRLDPGGNRELWVAKTGHWQWHSR